MNIIRQTIYANATLSKQYIIMNILATIIACYGLLADSTAVVIGAMLIAMLLGPIIGIALGLLEEGNNLLLKQALLAEVVGVIMVISVAFIVGMMHQDIPIGKELLARTQPNIFDLVIALAGGAAGAYAVASPQLSGGLVGVAIATALVPPLSTASILLARGEPDMAAGAFLLFFANFIAIQFSASVVLWLLGYHPIKTSPHQSFMHLLFRNAFSGLILVGLGIILSINLTQSVSKRLAENKVLDTIKIQLLSLPDAQLVDFVAKEEDKVLNLQLTLRTSNQLGYWDVVNLQKAIADKLQQAIALQIINIPTVKLDTMNPPAEAFSPDNNQKAEG